MKSPKLETFAESFAFRDSHKAFPIERITINNGSLYSVAFDYAQYEAWLEDFREFGEASIDSANRQEWLDAYAHTPVTGFGGSNVKKLWQAPQKLQNQVYACARRHPYCQEPGSRDWCHPSEVTA